MRSSLRLAAVLLALAATSLAGCSDGDDEAQAKVRLLNVSSGYQSLDLYITDSDNDTDRLRAEAVALDEVSDYSSVDSGTYDIKFKRNGVNSTLASITEEKLADDTHTAYVAYGASGNFKYLTIDEDTENPDDEDIAKVQVVNAAEDGSVDVYLTDSDVDLDDASPLVGGVASGAAPSTLTYDAGEYRLRVTGVNDTDDVRLDVPSITLNSKKVAAIVLSNTQGGVLVNGAKLAKRNELTLYQNDKARVRGAQAISSASGSRVALSVGGVDLLGSNGSAIGTIGQYELVDAGSASVTLTVDGNSVTVDNQTLTAGGDYTVLVWSESGTTRTTLIADDNHLPLDTGDAKVRLINGLSANGYDLTLSVDASPIAEGILLGEASDYTEVDNSTESQLDVANTDTGETLLSKTEVTLEASAVYTYMVWSSGGTLQSTLRKDRD